MAKLSHVIKLVVIVALAASAVLVLAFGPRGKKELPAGFVIVDYWEKWTGDEEAGMRQIVDDFNRTVGKQKHIFVRYLSMSGIEQKTLVSTAAGVPPDIAGLYNQDIPQFAAMDALTPLDTMAAADGITAGYYKKVFWDECRYQGHLYGLVSTAYDIGLYYNKEIFREHAGALRAAGLDPNRAPRSIAELDAYAEALDEKDRSGRLTLAGYLPLEPGWYQNYTCVWFGGSWWDQKDHKFTFTSPGVVRAYQWIQSYSKRIGPQSETSFRSALGNFNSPQNAFLAGLVAMEQQGTFFANIIDREKPSMRGKWGVAPFPASDPKLKDVTYCNCDVMVIPRGSKHKSAAFKFMAFVNRQDEMEKLANLHGKISPLAKVSEGFLEHHRNPYIRIFNEMADGPNAHGTEPVPILNQVTDEMNNFVQRLALLEVTPRQGLAQMQKRLQKAYDSFIHDQQERRQIEARN